MIVQNYRGTPYQVHRFTQTTQGQERGGATGGQPGGRTEAESEPSHGRPEGRTQGLSRSGGHQEAEQKDRAGLGDGQQG